MKTPVFVLFLVILFIFQVLLPLPGARAEGMALPSTAAMPLLWPPDCNRQPPLLSEPETRELVRQIQEQMKVSLPADPDVIFENAEKLADQDKYREAIPLYTKVYELRSDYPRVLGARAYAYAKTGQWDRAFRDVDADLEKNPSSAKAYYSHGTVYLVKEDYAWAIIDYEKSLQIDPSDKCTHNNIALAYEGTGNSAAAITHYSRALEIDPDFRKALANRADLYFRHQFYFEAFMDYVRLAWLSLRGK
jgi:tetratricopeptide (TPR) repeat protein